jgi:hypothetical protein
MWNSITGTIDALLESRQEVASDATAVIYGTFAASSLVAPAITNMAGPRATLFVGTLGYLLYVLSLLNFRYNPNKTGEALVLLAAVCNGFCAALLWTAQGQLCMAYPTDNTRGFYLGLFWVIFNFGGVVGGIVAFATNIASEGSTVGIETIICFVAIMGFGTLLTVLLKNPEDIRRADGSRIVIEKADWRSEAAGTLKLFRDPTMMSLMPLFIYSNWFYAYQFGPFQSIFNARTQSINNTFYWGAQMIGAYLIGNYLDRPSSNTRSKAVRSFGLFSLYTLVVWGLTAWANVARNVDEIQKQQGCTDDPLDSSPTCTVDRLDFTDSNGRYFLPLFSLYFASGLADAFVQNWSYWLMGNLTRDVGTLSRYAGFYKGAQAVGGAISWKLNGSGVSGLGQISCNVVLFIAALPLAFIVASKLPDDDGEANELGGGEGGRDSSSCSFVDIDAKEGAVVSTGEKGGAVGAAGAGSSPQLLHVVGDAAAI